jgi:ferredoxin
MSDPTALRVVNVDLERCVGHGKCYLIAPDLMEPFDDEGHSRFHGQPIDPDDSKQLARGQSVIDSCPEQALSWGDAGSS